VSDKKKKKRKKVGGGIVELGELIKRFHCNPRHLTRGEEKTFEGTKGKGTESRVKTAVHALEKEEGFVRKRQGNYSNALQSNYLRNAVQERLDKARKRGVWRTMEPRPISIMSFRRFVRKKRREGQVGLSTGSDRNTVSTSIKKDP